jgi:hypothetical protein
MGEYIYKVTRNIVLDKVGRKANLLEFAYKPRTRGALIGDDKEVDKANTKAYYENGCYNARRYIKHGKTFTGRVVMDAGLDSITWPCEIISDWSFDNKLYDIERGTQPYHTEESLA